jgi:FkbM family methyltransferase
MQRTFQDVVREGSVVYDIGANAGFFTLMAAKLTGPSGRVFAFEPAPRNCGFIRKHADLNRCRNVSVFEMAVSSANGDAFFDFGADACQGHLSDQGTLKVFTVTIDSLVYDRSVPAPDVIKIDVEGAEADVLKGALQTLRQSRPTVLLATHSFEARQECRRTLDDCGYEVKSLEAHPVEQASELIARPRVNPFVGSNR